jgi:hypothetical protein
VGERGRLKQLRRKIADAVRPLEPAGRVAAVNELLDHHVISPKKGRELLEMRGGPWVNQGQRNNLPDP